MSYEPMPPAPEGSHLQHSGAPPQTVRRAVVLILVNIALSALGLVLSFLYVDELVEATSDADANAAILDAARALAIGVGVVGFLIFGGLYLLLAIFIRKGANWARIVWTVLTVLSLVFAAIGLFVDQPFSGPSLDAAQMLAPQIIRVVSLLLSFCALVLLWAKDSNAYFRGSRVPRRG